MNSAAPKVLLNGVGVEMLVGVSRRDRSGRFIFPVNEVFGGRRANSATPVAEIPPVGSILVPSVIPEGEVLRVEGTVGNHRGFAASPASAVPLGRVDGPHPVRSPHTAKCLVSRTPAGVPGLESSRTGEVVRAGAEPHDIILLRPLPLAEAQVRLAPVNAVLAFRIAGDLLVLCLLLHIMLPTAVDHAVDVAVLKKSEVAAGITLPRLVCNQDHLLCFWL